jgi:hypothetical protein
MPTLLLHLDDYKHIAEVLSLLSLLLSLLALLVQECKYYEYCGDNAEAGVLNVSIRQLTSA